MKSVRLRGVFDVLELVWTDLLTSVCRNKKRNMRGGGNKSRGGQKEIPFETKF